MNDYPLIDVDIEAEDDYRYDGRELRWCHAQIMDMLNKMVGNLWPSILLGRLNRIKILYYHRYGRSITHVGPPPKGGYWDRPSAFVEGSYCRELNCSGTFEYIRNEPCSCHIHPPCSSCVDAPLTCNQCGYIVED